uniref:Uncharacterized protein n=1 Tax=Chromera velia CCMP2878 TaxID=1169474 RepID=A0A0G4HJ58_9ALVE|eukprot:Cvel_7043.t1-p1 / transcript=Cvel_7043.t1 / gene=Cvel_7043 / organism=Chromera_velia_CCMP2878 / gene_product=hypothetical protein / transcript_product=hypothetical protein / location=Cvel_scaffold359:74071-75387(+) / protein_length=439 / sequence_SO=supercontig / SO=protein_coding / is_pseudo=false
MERKGRLDGVRRLFNCTTKATLIKASEEMSKIIAAVSITEYKDIASLIVEQIRTTPPDIVVGLLSDGVLTGRFCSLLERTPRLHYLVVGELQRTIQSGGVKGEKDFMYKLGFVCSRILSPSEVKGGLQIEQTYDAKSFVSSLTFLITYTQSLCQINGSNELGPKNTKALYRLLVTLNSIKNTPNLRLDASAVFSADAFSYENEIAPLKEKLQLSTSDSIVTPYAVPPFALQPRVLVSLQTSAPHDDPTLRSEDPGAAPGPFFRTTAQETALDELLQTDITHQAMISEEEERAPSPEALQRMTQCMNEGLGGAAAFFGEISDRKQVSESTQQKPMPAQLKRLTNYIQKTEIPSLQKKRSSLLLEADQQGGLFLKTTDKEEGRKALDRQHALIQEADGFQEAENTLIQWAWRAEADREFPEGEVPKEVTNAVNNLNTSSQS